MKHIILEVISRNTGESRRKPEITERCMNGVGPDNVAPVMDYCQSWAPEKRQSS